jgi:integrase
MPKSRKGTVSVSSQEGMLRLRWRWNGKPYALTLGLFDSPLHRRLAEAKAAEIQADIAYERFDPTLTKYRSDAPAPTTTRPTSELWQMFTASRLTLGQISAATEAARYRPLLSNLVRFGRPIDQTTAPKFIDYLRSRQSPRIANQNLSLLRTFGDWCQAAGHWPANHFKGIAPAKGAESRREGEPFTREEIRKFLEVVRGDRHYRHYHDLCLFMFHTGCRPSEALTLKWKQVDLAAGTVKIHSTKTDSSHPLKLQPSVVQMLRDRPRQGELVFPGPRGKAISPRNFCQRCWKAICKRAEIPYRVPYFARHSLASHMIDKGASYPQVAYVLGHKSTRMVQSTYGRMVEPPELPEF